MTALAMTQNGGMIVSAIVATVIVAWLARER